MKKQMILMAASVFLLGQLGSVPVQAAEFSMIQPYLSADNKIGFTDGKKRVTNAVYDSIMQYPGCVVVTAKGKQGILDARTGEEITPVIWDQIEIPDGKQIAILQKDGWFQYLDLSARKLSAQKFAGAHTYFLSQERPAVIAMGGQTSMLLDPSGEVMIPPFAGKIFFADLRPERKAGEADGSGEAEESVRYVLTVTAAGFTLYDPVSLQPRFSLDHAEYLPQDGAKTAYLRVRSGSKEGLVDIAGRYVLEPKFNRLVFWNHGFVRVESDQGVGLWKDGEMLAEPRFDDVAVESGTSSVYSTKSGNTVTYHSLGNAGSITLRTGAVYLRDGYVLGQELNTGLYGVAKASGEVVIPFRYPRVEGPPAALLLVRSDGKKGLIPGYELPMAEPSVWFDTAATLGTYSMLSIQEGRKIGLYSEQKGLLLEPALNRVIHYQQENGLVKVEEPDGQTLYYRMDGTLHKPEQEAVNTLTERLGSSFSPGEGMILIDRQTGQPISRAYSRALYYNTEADLVVGLDEAGETADLYTADGRQLIGGIKAAVLTEITERDPVTMARLGEAVYTLGKMENADGLALVKLDGEQLTAVSEFAYRDIQLQEMKGGKLLALTRSDGTLDLCAPNGLQELNRLTKVSQFQIVDALQVVLVKEGAGWDVYSPSLERLTQTSYPFLQMITSQKEGNSLLIYQDGQTGLYGVMGTDFRPATPPLYTSIQATDQVFVQHLDVETPPFLFVTAQHFGYLDAQGRELFRMERTSR